MEQCVNLQSKSACVGPIAGSTRILPDGRSYARCERHMELHLQGFAPYCDGEVADERDRVATDLDRFYSGQDW